MGMQNITSNFSGSALLVTHKCTPQEAFYPSAAAGVLSLMGAHPAARRGKPGAGKGAFSGNCPSARQRSRARNPCPGASPRPESRPSAPLRSDSPEASPRPQLPSPQVPSPRALSPQTPSPSQVSALPRGPVPSPAARPVAMAAPADAAPHPPTRGRRGERVFSPPRAEGGSGRAGEGLRGEATFHLKMRLFLAVT